MKKALVLLVVLVFSLSSLAFAVENATAPAPAKAAPAKAAPAKAAPAKAKVSQVTGSVTAVDAKAMTLTVKGKKGDVSLVATDKTKVLKGKEKKTLADVTVGASVTVTYSEEDGKMVAKKIAIK